MQDIIVFDIETKNTFADVGGSANIDKLETSVIGLYSYNQNEYVCYEEKDFDKAGALFQKAKLLVGFYSKKFDVPVMEKYFKFKLSAIPHYDILEEIEKVFGRRIGLGLLAEANVGAGKSAKGLDAIDFWKNGEIDKLKSYCLQDVKITKEIFDLIRSRGYLYIPKRDVPQMEKVMLEYKEKEVPQAQLL